MIKVLATFALSLMMVSASRGQMANPVQSDPLAVGRAALQKGDYAAAQKFFTDYVRDSPNDMEATYLAGVSSLELRQYPAAVDSFKKVAAASPKRWTIHNDLSMAYAGMGDWYAFDRERATLKAMRDNNEPGVTKDKGDLIDVLYVGDKQYEVKAFYTLYGTFKTRYVFLHFGADGKLADYIQCESDDADQGFFKERHPEKAKAGDREFSLDTYTIGKTGMAQGLIKFYADGEPSYETVRADVLKVLAGDAKPAATVTTPSKK